MYMEAADTPLIIISRPIRGRRSATPKTVAAERLFRRDIRAFKGHAAFHRVPERWEF
jgi:hypothetical protein